MIRRLALGPPVWSSGYSVVATSELYAPESKGLILDTPPDFVLV